MPAAKHFQPEGYHAITPYLVVRGASKAIDFYKKVFGATEIMRMPEPGGKIAHAELRIGDSVIMLADEHPERGAISPSSAGGTPVGLMLYVKDVDATFNTAIAQGSKVERELMDQFYGDRSGTVIDPFGHKWNIATHKEDVSPEEMQARMARMGG
jgi:PhnB protein